MSHAATPIVLLSVSLKLLFLTRFLIMPSSYPKAKLSVPKPVTTNSNLPSLFISVTDTP